MRIFTLFFITSLFSTSAYSATWTTSAGDTVAIINPGAIDGAKSTYVSLSTSQFSSCSRTDGAVLLESNQNYNEIFSLIVAAKMSGQKIRAYL